MKSVRRSKHALPKITRPVPVRAPILLSTEAPSDVPLPAADSASATRPARQRLGELAVSSGLLTPPQIDDAVHAQEAAASAGLNMVLGEVLLKKKLLTHAQLDELLNRQSRAEQAAAEKNAEKINRPAVARHSGVTQAVLKSETKSLPAVAPEKVSPPKKAVSPARGTAITPGPAASKTAAPQPRAKTPPAAVASNAAEGVKRSRTFGDYYLFSELGRGAMGVVYVAQQVSTQRDVALKILYPDKSSDPEFRARHLREAAAVMRLNHPNIVAGVDAGCVDGLYYFAMEFVDGKPLNQVMADNGGDLPEKAALDIARHIALALHHAHSQEILHRDIKPENILIAFDGAPKLCDLGLVRDGASNECALTQIGETVGSAYYISPEQARGDRNLTPASDLYSLGATLFHVLTGQPPYNSPSPTTVLLNHATAPIPDPRAIHKKISEPAARIVMKLLAKNPLGRYADGAALAKDLERAIAGQMPAFMSRRSPGEVTQKFKTVANQKEGLFKRMWNSIVGGGHAKKPDVKRRDSTATLKAVKAQGRREKK